MIIRQTRSVLGFFSHQFWFYKEILSKKKQNIEIKQTNEKDCKIFYFRQIYVWLPKGEEKSVGTHDFSSYREVTCEELFRVAFTYLNFQGNQYLGFRSYIA